jgi:hypothetical protein
MPSRKDRCIVTVQTVKLGGKRFVIVAEKDFRRLQEKAAQLSAQDRADIAIARKRLNDPREKPIPYERVRKELGIA